MGPITISASGAWAKSCIWCSTRAARPAIVSIKKPDEVAVRQRQAAITRRGRPLICLRHTNDVVAELARHCKTGVSRAIIHDDDLYRGAPLAQDAGKGIRQGIFAIEHGNNDTQRRQIRFHGPATGLLQIERVDDPGVS